MKLQEASESVVCSGHAAEKHERSAEVFITLVLPSREQKLLVTMKAMVTSYYVSSLSSALHPANSQLNFGLLLPFQATLPVHPSIRT